MKNIRVYLQYPLRVSDSQYYRSMIDNPPKGVEFVGSKKTGMVVNTRKFRGFDNFKRGIKAFLNNIPLPIPNAHYTRKRDFDLIHCTHCLSLNRSPWVADIEFITQMWGGVKLTSARKRIVSKIISSKHCKKIMAWTEATKKNIVEMFPEIKEKVEVVYYALPEMERRKKDAKDIVLFFSGRHFYAKGGLHATEIMDRLTRKYPNVKGVINGAIPEEIISKYSKNKKLTFHQLMPYKDVLKLYQKADIFVYPGYSDSFGFVYMEAMAFGVPIVTADGHSRREIIKNGKQGFIVDIPKEMVDCWVINKYEDILKDMISKIELLIKDKRLRKKMGIAGLKEVKSGKFSLKRRNTRLKKIYEEALR